MSVNTHTVNYEQCDVISRGGGRIKGSKAVTGVIII